MFSKLGHVEVSCFWVSLWIVVFKSTGFVGTNTTLKRDAWHLISSTCTFELAVRVSTRRVFNLPLHWVHNSVWLFATICLTFQQEASMVICECWRSYRCQSHLSIFAPAANENGTGTHTWLALLISNMLSQTQINIRSNEKRSGHANIMTSCSETWHIHWVRNNYSKIESNKGRERIRGKQNRGWGGGGRKRLSGLISYYPWCRSDGRLVMRQLGCVSDI